MFLLRVAPLFGRVAPHHACMCASVLPHCVCGTLFPIYVLYYVVLQLLLVRSKEAFFSTLYGLFGAVGNGGPK